MCSLPRARNTPERSSFAAVALIGRKDLVACQRGAGRDVEAAIVDGLVPSVDEPVGEMGHARLPASMLQVRDVRALADDDLGRGVRLAFGVGAGQRHEGFDEGRFARRRRC